MNVGDVYLDYIKLLIVTHANYRYYVPAFSEEGGGVILKTQILFFNYG